MGHIVEGEDGQNWWVKIVSYGTATQFVALDAGVVFAVT